MHLLDAQTLANQLIDQHLGPSWTFGFNNARRSFGVCKYTPRRIELSRHLVKINDEPQVRDTILHEIAHALAGYTAAHGPEWRRTARELGATPTRCYSNDDVNTPARRWIGECGEGCTFERDRLTGSLRNGAARCRNHSLPLNWSTNPAWTQETGATPTPAPTPQAARKPAPAPTNPAIASVPRYIGTCTDGCHIGRNRLAGNVRDGHAVCAKHHNPITWEDNELWFTIRGKKLTNANRRAPR